MGKFRALLKEDLFPIPADMRNKKFAVVLTEQMLAPEHGPTKIVLDRCKVLIEQMERKVLEINTAEVLSQRGAVSFFDNVGGNYISEFLSKESLY